MSQDMMQRQEAEAINRMYTHKKVQHGHVAATRPPKRISAYEGVRRCIKSPFR